MLQSLKDLFDALTPTTPDHDAGGAEHALQLAVAVLLVEVMRADTSIGAAERRTGLTALRERFALADDELTQLLALAERTAREAYDYHQFTSRINDHFDAEQKLRIVETMWQVAYADGRLDAGENHVMGRLSDLLHVPRGAYIGAKMRAKEAAGRT